METFDVTMTATLRPELIERTLQSFHQNLWKDWVDYARFYVNVDCIGCDERLVEMKMMEVKEVFNIFTGTVDDAVKFNFSLEPNFPKAWLWCVKNTTSRLVFHLEEDWEMNFEQDFESMYGMFTKYPNLKHLRLNLFVSTDESIKMWGRHFANWNGDFYEIEDKSVIAVGWCGHPSLNDGDWLRGCANVMHEDKNPEKQFHYNVKVVGKYVAGKQFGLFHKRGAGRGIRDIGRQWRVEHGYHKAGGINDEHFTHWIKDEKTN